MSDFHYYHPIEVRYGDIDAQGHVNNAKYLTYLEQARLGYVRRLGLWDGCSFLNLGIILADAQVTYKAPILLGHPVQVGLRVSRLGNKSLDMEYAIENTESGLLYARAKTVLVTYDYTANKTILIPDDWRRKIGEFEGIGTWIKTN